MKTELIIKNCCLFLLNKQILVFNYSYQQRITQVKSYQIRLIYFLVIILFIINNRSRCQKSQLKVCKRINKKVSKVNSSIS